MSLNFEDYVGGIEDGILTALKSTMTSIGVNSFATYSGDMEAESLKKQLASFAHLFPRVLVSYTDGTDTHDSKTSPVAGRPIQFRHDCWFAVIVATNDARSDSVRRRGSANALGAYTMIAKVRETLSGLVIRKIVNGEPQVLTFNPLMPVSNEYILRIPNVTAYAVIFNTFFRWRSSDRTAAGFAVSTLDLAVGGLNQHNARDVATLPGVEFET